ncbi:MAG: DUF2634 domain-containing protein [Anaerovoracaceae bacterium]
MIPQNTNVNFIPRNNLKRQTSRTYKIDTTNNRIIGKTDGIDAMKQAIEKIILTEKYAYLIYDWTYGIGIEKYLGKDFDYIAANIKEEIRRALSFDDRIITVQDVQMQRTGIDSCYILYKVITTEGEVEGQINI